MNKIFKKTAFYFYKILFLTWVLLDFFIQLLLRDGGGKLRFILFPNLAKDLWLCLHYHQKRLKVFSALILGLCVLLAAFLLFSFFKQTLNATKILTSISLLLFLNLLFFYLKWRADWLYFQQYQSYKINSLSSALHGKLLRTYSNISFPTLLKIQFLCFSTAAIIMFISAEMHYHRARKALDLTEQIRAIIQAKKNISGVLEKDTHFVALFISWSESRMLRLDSQKRDIQRSLYEQYGALQEMQKGKEHYDQIAAEVNAAKSQGKSVREIEESLRKLPEIWHHILGSVKSSLLLQGKEEEAIEKESLAYLNEEGQALKTFEEIPLRYAEILEKAMNGIYRDQQKMEEFQQKIENEKLLVENLRLMQKEDKSLNVKVKNSVKDYQQLLNQRIKEEMELVKKKPR